MNESFVVIGRFPTAATAYLAKGHLESSGIPAFISDENTGSLFGNATCWVKVHVAEENYIRALAVLESEMKFEEQESSEDIMPPDDQLTRPTKAYASAPPDDPEEVLRRQGALTPDAEQTGAIAPIELGLRDRTAGRAFVGAMISLILLPFFLPLFLLVFGYVAYVTLRVWLADGPFQPRGWWCFVGAVLILSLDVLLLAYYWPWLLGY